MRSDQDHYRVWLVAVFSGLMILLMRGITDPDIWTHLTIGREVFRLRGIPSAEFYVAPLAGQPGHFNEWGYGVVLYLIELTGGITALAVFNAAIAAATFTLLFDILRRRLNGNLWLALPCVLLGVWIADFRLNFRPEMLMYLAVFASLWGMERYRQTPRIRWLLPLMGAGLILPQFHPSILLCLIVVGAHSIEYLHRPQTRRYFFEVLGAALVAVVLANFNPYGFEQIILPIKFALDAPLISGITELLPALQTEVAPQFIVSAAIALFGFTLTRQRSRVGDVLLVAVFGWLAYQHARNVALFGLLALLPLASGLARIQGKFAGKWGVAVALIALALVGSHSVKASKWGVGIDLAGTPVKAGKILSEMDLKGPVLGFFHLGNYLAWTLYPKTKVIADARHFGFNESIRLHDHLFSALDGWESEVREAKISAVVTPMTMPYSGEFVPLALALLRSPDWSLVASEEAGLTFLPIGTYRGPVLPANAAWDRALTELKLNLGEYPDSAVTKKNLEFASMAKYRVGL